jgi:hypothetical protein
MLGDVISEGHGKRTARRVTAVEPHFKVEVSFEENAKILGVDSMDIGTYTASSKGEGNLEGYGEGVIATSEGETVTWKGLGAGKMRADGAVSYRGALTFSTASKKLARLNSVAGAFEFEVDANGNTTSKIWEWK